MNGIHLFPIISLWICIIPLQISTYIVCSCSRACNSKETGQIRLEFNLIQDFMPVLVTSKFDKDPIKIEHTSVETPFFHYKSMGNFFMLKGM